jgi:hypothetical protein
MIDNRNNSGQTKISFNDDRDDLLYENLFGRKVYFTESQIKNIVDNEKYIENDYNEKWEKQDVNSDIFKTIKSKLNFDNKSNLGLADVAKVLDDEYTEPGDTPNYIAIIRGGLNGSGDWKDYLTDMIAIIKKINGSYVIDLDVDVPDDVWTLKLGFYKEKLNEGASGYQPEDSDSYFDTCYTISEELFNGILEKLEKCYEDKNDNMIYTYLGIINHLLQIQELQSPIYYSNKDLENDKPEGNPLGIKLIKTCVKCYKYLQSDKNNKQGWKNFEEYKEKLLGQYSIFKNSMKLRNNNTNVQPVRAYHLDESDNLDENWKGYALGAALGAASLFSGGNHLNAQNNRQDTIGYTVTMPNGETTNYMRNSYSPDEWKYTNDYFKKQCGKASYSENELIKMCPAAYADRNKGPEVWQRNQSKYVIQNENGKVNISGKVAASHGQNPWYAILNSYGTQVTPIVNESKNFVEPQKVLVVKKFLDDNFVRAAVPTIGNDGYSKTLLIIGMKGSDGKVIRNMYAQQLFDLLQDKFKNIYLDKQKRDNFLKRVMKDWYDKKITKNGLLSVNTY